MRWKLQALCILVFSFAPRLVASAHPPESAAKSETNTIGANTALAPLSVRGRIVDAKPYGQPRSGVDQFRVVADVEETFEGPAFRQLVFAAYRMTEDAPIRQRDIGAEMLLFLRPSQLGEQERRDCDGCGWELDDDAGITPFVHLTHPVPERVLGEDLEVLTDPDAILAAVRSVNRTEPKGHSIIQVLLSSNRVIGLLDDGKLAEWARQWSVSDDPDHRSASIDLLQSLADADSEARLVHLLKDPYLMPLVESCEEFNPWTERNYFIRQRAWDALRARNAALVQRLPPPAFSADPGIYHSIAPAWGIVCGAGLLLSMTIAWLWLSRPNQVRRWWIAAGTVAIIVCGVAAAGRIWLIDFTNSNNGKTTSLTFVEGKLITWNYPSIEEQLPEKRVVGAFRIGNDPPNWHDPTAAPDPAERQLFAEVHVISLWPAMLFPLLPASIGFLAWKRRRIRLRTHCCVACGYDLRASTDRCPECGQPIASSWLAVSS